MRLVLACVLLLGAPGVSAAQGCSQCQQAMGQTPARTQTAYRRAILTMMTAATLVAGGSYLALRRFR